MARTLAMWHKMKPLRVENFQYFWDLFKPDELMTDVENAEFRTDLQELKGWRTDGMFEK